MIPVTYFKMVQPKNIYICGVGRSKREGQESKYGKIITTVESKWGI